VNPLPYCFLSSVPILELFLFPNCPIVDTGPQPFNALAGPLAMMDRLHEMLNKMGANANDLRAEYFATAWRYLRKVGRSLALRSRLSALQPPFEVPSQRTG
jgi:hypothetical protein